MGKKHKSKLFEEIPNPTSLEFLLRKARVESEKKRQKSKCT